ncbi:ribonucleotide reductase of class III (anaerobic) [Escherichia phage vB_EcoM_3A1_SA_NWU]|uniref:Anaerobic ribonucleoside-triphosphate reductase activating protein n=1 Tax=Escherichia phage nepoznato TaxID=2696431 RepID=A0A6B9WLP5_9CAUD|nr:anaerobic ribonucleoside-triphosphate reductase activating protein [Escherichia coli]YP_009986049.1 anaerobic ribonucleotide reductase small subunit [Escherichia phage nepoznato]WIL78264.1 ribonucleotide reductase of class III (anaerobic) [Escherichia phage vB_EcoM_3A1_SA_NWU]MCC5410017.1 anaerobic ribonucleoside-triphosphate reductase activating protein [Escherichia coli]MCC5411297.1 anaerobic ribonucleoside-triphosphate reductase activating protein [Escherichia coli]QHR65644.1 anaerobic r
MNFAGYEPVDLINGEGVRCSLWVSGCSHGCRGCFNQKAWSYSYGEPFTHENVEQVLKDLSRPFVKGLTILGGEPLDPQNIYNVKSLIEKVRDVYGSSKDIMVYTGYTFEEVPLYIKNLVDIIVDGKYEINNPTTKPFRGSDNQRLWTKTASGWQSD